MDFLRTLIFMTVIVVPITFTAVIFSILLGPNWGLLVSTEFVAVILTIYITYRLYEEKNK